MARRRLRVADGRRPDAAMLGYSSHRQDFRLCRAGQDRGALQPENRAGRGSRWGSACGATWQSAPRLAPIACRLTSPARCRTRCCSTGPRRLGHDVEPAHRIALHLQAAIVVPLGRGIVSSARALRTSRSNSPLPPASTSRPCTALHDLAHRSCERGGFNAGSNRLVLLPPVWRWRRRPLLAGGGADSRRIRPDRCRRPHGRAPDCACASVRPHPLPGAAPVKPPPPRPDRISRLTGRQSAQPTGPGQARKTRVVSDRDRPSAAAS